MAWKKRYTGIVGRNRQNAVRTADSGISSRGKAVLISSRPEPVTDVAPLRRGRLHHGHREQRQGQVGEAARGRGAAG